MPPATPYSGQLGDREPLEAMRDATARIQALAERWSDADFERSYEPGKWPARQILVHLAQTELALGARARLALTIPNYVAQAFDQDDWMRRERDLGARDALAAFVAISRMNVAFFGGLSAAERAVSFSHPEYGSISVDWIIHQMAGHQLHHCEQLLRIV